MLPASYRGINLHPIWYTDATLDQVCQLLATSRVDLVRIDVPLNFMFTLGRGKMHPGYVERLTRFLAECPAHIEVLIVAAYTPAWANGGQALNVPWASTADFAAALTQLVQAFPRASAWEVWNEPDLDYAWSHSTGTVEQRAATYVSLLGAAAGAIRQSGSSAKVVAPVISGPSAAPWLAAFYAANPHGLYDVFSAHVYGDPPSHGNLSPVDTVQALAASIWPLVATNGDGLREFWITETGANTSPTGVSVAQQATILTQTFQQIDQQAPACRRVYWYELLDDRADTTPDDCYGLLTSVVTQKGDGSAWAAFNALP